MSKIGLALGGGGAKGLAHIGVLRALEELGIQADIIAGTSMGGVIGAAYAAGLSVDRIEAIVRGMGLTILAAREPGGLGMFGTAKIRRLLRDVLAEEVTFDQLTRKLALVAVDLEAQAEIVLDSGRVVDAALATMAFPGLFAPVLHDGHHLIDGGVLNNVPFDVARRQGADYVIACDVIAHHAPLFQDPLPASDAVQSFLLQLLTRTGAATLWRVVDCAVAIMQEQMIKDKLAQCPPDVLICPQVGAVGLFDVRQLDYCLSTGIAAVREHEAELVRLRDEAARPPAPPSAWDRLRGLFAPRVS